MKKLLLLLLVLVVAGSVYYFGFNGKDKLAQILDGAKPGSETSGTSENGEAVSGSSTILEPASVFKEPVTYSSLSQAYSGQYFNFKYSDGFTVSSVPVSAKEEMVTIENKKGSGFQVFIMPWDEKGMVTPERIWQDEPEADVLEPKVADLDGVQSLVFYGYNGDMGETFEVWSVKNGKLYQITGPKTAEDLIIDTLETWGWK